LVQGFWIQQRRKLPPAFVPGRLKQWLVWLSRNYPEAAALFTAVRQENDCIKLDAILGLKTLMESEHHPAEHCSSLPA
jgi:tRNA-dihydrouridine synthase C